MIQGYQFGHAKGQYEMWCIHRLGAKATMLCGWRIGFIPVSDLQPVAPKNVHRVCIEAMYALGERPVPREDPGFGTCPECEGDAAVVGGLISRHGAWRMGSGGTAYVSATRCLGEGSRPEVDR